MTPRDIRLLIIILASAAVLWFGVSWFRGYQEDQRRLAELETFVTSVENRDKVSEAIDEDFYDRSAAAATRAAQARTARKKATQATRTTADENPTVAAYLDTRIPDELRRADREARLSGGLGSSRDAGENPRRRN